MQVQITPKDFKAATVYGDSWGCPLACALKRTLGHSDLSVGGYTVSIRKNISLNIKGADDTYSFRCQKTGKGYTNFEINNLLEKAKRGEDVPTIDIELI